MDNDEKGNEDVAPTEVTEAPADTSEPGGQDVQPASESAQSE